MLDFFQMIASGIAVGSSYALMGLAMVIIYKTSEVVNFAQGEMALVSVFLTYMVLEFHGFPFYVAFPCSLLFAVFLGCFLEFAVLRRAKEPNVLGMIIITIGLEMILMGIVSWRFGADPKTMPFPIAPYDSVTLGSIFVSGLEVLTFVVALTIMVILFLFLRYSKLGIAMKATQQNKIAAKVMGIRTNRVLMITWGISSLVGSVAGILIAPTHATLHDVGPDAQGLCRRSARGDDFVARFRFRRLRHRHHRKPFWGLHLHRIQIRCRIRHHRSCTLF
jgi:branched-chain amino acid transport system permease protein